MAAHRHTKILAIVKGPRFVWMCKTCHKVLR